MGDNHHGIGVRYCGGCNSRYDRVALVQRLKSFFPDESFVPAQEGVPYSAVLVVCGCSTRCANVSDLAVPPRCLIWVGGFEDLLPARDALRQMLGEQEVFSLDHEQVMDVLPHRPPMLFIDTVSRLIPGKEIRADFHASPDLPAFAGHFPGEPVLPGVYTAEAVAQAADILMMTTQRYAKKLPLFLGIDQCSFRSKVLPGDTLEIHVSLLKEQQERSIALCRGQVFVQKTLAADMEVRLAFL